MTLWLGVPDPPSVLLEAQPPPVTHTVAPGQNLPALGPGQHAKLLTGTHTQFTGDVWNLAGSPANPCFVTQEPGTVIDCNSSDSQVRPRGSWFVLQGLKSFRSRFSFGDDGGWNSTDFAVRDFEGWGLDEDGNGTVLNLRASKRALVLRPHIHDNGTPSANEPGMNAMTASGVDASGVPAQDIWILDGTCYRNRGDHVRIGRPTGEIPERIYIAGNLFWEDPTRPDNAIGENGIDIKLSRDVVLSENCIYGFRSTPTSPGEGIVIHDNASWVWALANELADCQQGIATTSGTNIFYLRNFIRDMASRCFRVTGSVVATHNTLRRSPIGIYASGPPGTLIANLMDACAEPFSLPSGGTLSHNVTSGALFAGPDTAQLLAGSAGINAGIEGPGYAAFAARYGFSILPAWQGNPDVGCYELVTGGAPSPITDLQVLVEA